MNPTDPQNIVTVANVAEGVSGMFEGVSFDGGQTWKTSIIADEPNSSIGLGDSCCDPSLSFDEYGNLFLTYLYESEGTLPIALSTDGGLTWSAPAAPQGTPSGLGGQPVAQPNGNVIVPFSENDAAIGSFRSTDGGLTWSAVTTVAGITDHGVAGGLRTSPLPSAEVDQQGRVYVVWQDCRFRSGCARNDIVMSTSVDGVTWSQPMRIPIDDTSSTVDHFIPGIAVDRATLGSTARLALGYYYFILDWEGRPYCHKQIMMSKPLSENPHCFRLVHS